MTDITVTREELATYIVDSMDLESVMQIVYEMILDGYEESKEAFEFDLQKYQEEMGL